MNPRYAFLALAILFLCAAMAFAATAQTTNQARLPIPDPAARTAAEKDVRELFKEEYKVQTEDGRRILATAMLKQADSNEVKGDPASRFVLLRDARNTALDAGDFQLAQAAADATAAAFDVDPIDARFEMLDQAFRIIYGDPTTQSSELGAIDVQSTKMDKTIRLVYQNELALHWLALVDQALKANHMPMAKQAASQAVVAAERTDDVDLQGAARLATNRIATSDDLTKLAEALHAKLKETPDDADANLMLGKYYCFIRDDWETGRPFLIKGDDSDLKTLAQRDLDAGKNPPAAWTLAGDWWKYSAEATDKIGPISGKRRAVWYKQELANFSALKKATAEKRIADFASEAIDPDHGAVVDLLALIDVKTAKREREWKRVPDGISCPEMHSNITAPYSPPEEYDVYFDFTRDTGKETVGMQFPMAKGWAGWVFGSQGNKQEGIDDATSRYRIYSGKYEGIVNKHLYHTVLKVRKDHVMGFLDGQPLAHLRTDGEGMKVEPNPMINNLPTFSAGTSGATGTINSWLVLEITGQGKVIAMPAAASQ